MKDGRRTFRSYSLYSFALAYIAVMALVASYQELRTQVNDHL